MNTNDFFCVIIYRPRPRRDFLKACGSSVFAFNFFPSRVFGANSRIAVAGIGAEIAAIAMEKAFDYLDAPVFRVTGADTPMPYARNLETAYLPNSEKVIEAAKSVCYR